MYLVVIALNIWVLPYVGEGPLWKSYSTTESDICRQNWWLNILFLSTMVDSKEVVSLNQPARSWLYRFSNWNNLSRQTQCTMTKLDGAEYFHIWFRTGSAVVKAQLCWYHITIRLKRGLRKSLQSQVKYSWRMIRLKNLFLWKINNTIRLSLWANNIIIVPSFYGIFY